MTAYKIDHALTRAGIPRGPWVADYPNLWPYVRDLYQEHGIADTVHLEECRRHYYRTQSSINPRGLVAVQPAVVEFTLPHDRAALARS